MWSIVARCNRQSSCWRRACFRAGSSAQTLRRVRTSVACFSSSQGGDGGGGKPSKQDKENFAKTVLEPAARGELKPGHKTGIPKLISRKGKGQGTRGEWSAEDLQEAESWEDNGQTEELADTSISSSSSKIIQAVEGSFAATASAVPPPPFPAFSQEPELYYWIESDYDDRTDVPKPEEVYEDEDGMTVLPYDKAELYPDGYNPDEDNDPPEDREEPMNPEDQYFWGNNDIMEYLKHADDNTLRNPPRDPKDFEIQPLAEHGTGLDSFLEAMIEHPTMYASYTRESPHPESRRIPRPDLPPHRQNPSLEWITSFRRYIFVTGLPPVLDTDDLGETILGDFENPLHRQQVQAMVASLFHVKTEQVSPASLTSAFVGFEYGQRDRVLQKGPAKSVFPNPVTIGMYDGASDQEDFVQNNDPETIVTLSNLPPNQSATHLAWNLFPEGTKSGTILKLKPDDFCIVAPTRALMRLPSKQHAKNALTSDMIQKRLEAYGQSRVQYFKARRNLVQTGHSGGHGSEPVHEQGPLLIVDGDMPTKDFFLSHGNTLMLRNLPPDVTKQELSDLFEPYCASRRDVEGSIEFVTCQEGNPTGRAYVGFDRPHEADDILKTFSGTFKLRGSRRIIMKKVKEFKVEGALPREQRSERTEAELLNDLNNWEQYVDPEDLQQVLASGVTYESIDDTLRRIRFRNKTFSCMDQAMRSEKLEQEREVGEHYRLLVQGFIKALKENASTPENPGPAFPFFFMPDEEYEYSNFENEARRLRDLQHRRENP